MSNTGKPINETRRECVDRRFGHMKQDRQAHEPQWRDLVDNFLPKRGRFDGQTENDRARKRVSLPNNTPLDAVTVASSGLHAGLTSPARPWQKTAIQDQDLAEWGPVRTWLEVVDKRMLSWYARSNLYQALPFMYGEYASFGAMCMLSWESDKTLLRFEPFTIGQYYLARDSEGNFDTLYRCFDWTVRQLVSRFGLNNCSARVRQHYESTSGREQKIKVLHAIEPSQQNESWDSCYYEMVKDGSNEGLLSHRNVSDNPIHAATWEHVLGDTYASNCPGMIALGDALALQKDERDKARGIDRHHNPPMQGPASLKLNGGISLLPGAMNWVDNAQATGQNGAIRPVHDFTPNISGLLDNIGRGESRINRAFFKDLFLMLTLDDRAQRATAEEIRAKYDEKVLALGPTLEQANQMLRGVHNRAFGAMVRRSRPIWEGRLDGVPLLPPPPKELEDVELMPEFISALQQAQRAQSLQGIERFASFAGSISQMQGKPSPKFDADQALDEYGAALGIPAGIIRDDEAVAAIRQSEQQQEKMAQLAQLAPALKDGAAAMKMASEAKGQDGESVMTAMTGGAA